MEEPTTTHNVAPLGGNHLIPGVAGGMAQLSAHSAVVRDTYDSFAEYVAQNESDAVTQHVSDYINFAQKYDTKFTLQAYMGSNPFDYASCAGDYYPYDIQINGHSAYFNEDQKRVIVNNGNGWMITSYFYYPLFEVECLADTLGGFHASTNGDVPLRESDWASYAISAEPGTMQAYNIAQDQVPYGSIVMDTDDVDFYADEVFDMMEEWYIWHLLDGKVDGAGYGNHITAGSQYAVSCETQWTLVMSNDGRPDQNLGSC